MPNDDELRSRLSKSATELHEMITSSDETNMFDSQRPLRDRVYTLELAVSEFTMELAKVAGLIAQLALAVDAVSGSKE